MENKVISREYVEKKNEKIIKKINDYIEICRCEELEDRYIGDLHSEYYRIFEGWLNNIKDLLEGTKDEQIQKQESNN